MNWCSCNRKPARVGVGRGSEAKAKWQNFVTVFVDNLPEKMNRLWLKTIFSWFGEVANVFIPVKRRKITNTRFGFVRFLREEEAIYAMEKIDGAWCLDCRLLVCRADSGNSEKGLKEVVVGGDVNESGKGLGHVKEFGKVGEGEVKSVRSKGSDSLVVEKVAGNKEFTFAEEWGKVKEVKFPFTKSFAEVIKSGLCVDVSSQYVKQSEGCGDKASVSIDVEEADMEWLYSSLIGWVRDVSIIQTLEDQLISEGAFDPIVRPLGGKAVLLSFCNKEEAMAMLSKGGAWVDRWFEKVEEWKFEFISKGRFVWLSCEGVPLQGWSTQTFKKISEIWGTFITIDDHTVSKRIMDRGRILISTEESDTISQNVELKVNGIHFSITVREEMGVSANDFLSFGYNYKKSSGNPMGNESRLFESDNHSVHFSDRSPLSRQPVQVASGDNEVVVLESSSIQKVGDEEVPASWDSDSNQNVMSSNSYVAPSSPGCYAHTLSDESNLNGKGSTNNVTSNRPRSSLDRSNNLQIVVFEPKKIESVVFPHLNKDSIGKGTIVAKAPDTLISMSEEPRFVPAEGTVDYGEPVRVGFDEDFYTKITTKNGNDSHKVERGKKKANSVVKRRRKRIAELGGPLARKLSTRSIGRKATGRKKSKEVSDNSISDGGIANRNRILAIPKQSEEACLRSEAESVWNLGQELGMTYNGDKEDILKIIIESEQRDNILFKKYVQGSEVL